MPPRFQGRDAELGFGKESTWGTEVARSVWCKVTAVSLAVKPAFEMSPTLLQSGGSANAKLFFQTEEVVSGGFDAIACYEGGSALGLLLHYALGAKSTAGSGPYTHTVTLASDLPPGLTGEYHRGTDTSGTEEYYGLTVNKFSMEVQAKQEMKLSVEFLGKNGGARASGGSSSYGTRYPILHNHGGTFSWNSGTGKVTRFKLSIDNKLQQPHEIGSLYPSQPSRNEHSEILIEVEILATSNTLRAAHLAGTQSDFAITFSDGTRSLAITGHNAMITSYEDGISGPGDVTQKVTFRCFSDGTDEGLSLVLTNSKSDCDVD